MAIPVFYALILLEFINISRDAGFYENSSLIGLASGVPGRALFRGSTHDCFPVSYVS
jgi:hypothetical protein